MTCGVYRIWSGDNTYIGQSRDITRRWRQHSVKYPTDVWNYEILIECPASSLDFFEKAFITGYDSFKNGLNKSPGSPGGYVRSLETRQKISNSNSHRKFSEESLHKMSQSAKSRGMSKCNESNHKIVKCPHCEKSGQQFGMGRWHFNNCKMIRT